MQIGESRDGQTVILSPSGDWDVETSPEFSALALRLAEAGSSRFAVDFRQVTFIDSSALACLISLYKRVKPTRGGDVKLFGMRPELLVIFRQTRLDHVFGIAETYEQLAGTW